MLNLEKFTKLAKDYDVIPLVREQMADFDTAISVASKFAKEKFYLLESVEGGEQWGRYSILGYNIDREFIIEEGQASLLSSNEKQLLSGNPVDAMQSYLACFKSYQREGLPRFCGGAVGYFSFESVRFFERCGKVKQNDSSFPDAHFFISDQLIIFDNLSHSIKLVYCVHPDRYETEEKAFNHGIEMLNKMQKDLSKKPTELKISEGKNLDMQSNMSEEEFLDIVTKAKEYVRAGDIIQVVLAQHFSTETSADPLNIYRALRFINPSPYLYFMNFGDDRAIAGSSPEVMVRVTDQKAELRPIAGTRPRGSNETEDQANADDLLADPKELAEHVMLVDLARNDLGRVSKTGSVIVKDYMVIERYSHVMHIVSQVESELLDGKDAIDVFKASFPAGTLSGAPKVRAMEIINELEPDPRGPYGGALGYIAYGGHVMDMAITIRTVVMEKNKATVTAGAGIVFDSVPESEFAETRHKSRGMRRALQLAENNLAIDGDLS